jgi:uncharacterized protein with FMN-binding domain
MRRAIPVVLATAGGAVLLANFHTSPSPISLAANANTSTSTETPITAVPRRALTTTTAPPLRSFAGPVVQTRWGPVQVRITIRARQLLDVEALQLPFAHPRSAEISRQAGPILRQEALQAQSARISLVSGASYTSVGYAQSLQAALNQANA